MKLPFIGKKSPTIRHDLSSYISNYTATDRLVQSTVKDIKANFDNPVALRFTRASLKWVVELEGTSNLSTHWRAIGYHGLAHIENYLNQDDKEARRCLQQALKLLSLDEHFTRARLYRDLAEISMKEGNYSKAKREIQAALNEHDSEPDHLRFNDKGVRQRALSQATQWMINVLADDDDRLLAGTSLTSYALTGMGDCSDRDKVRILSFLLNDRSLELMKPEDQLLIKGHLVVLLGSRGNLIGFARNAISFVLDLPVALTRRVSDYTR